MCVLVAIKQLKLIIGYEHWTNIVNNMYKRVYSIFKNKYKNITKLPKF